MLNRNQKMLLKAMITMKRAWEMSDESLEYHMDAWWNWLIQDLEEAGLPYIRYRCQCSKSYRYIWFCVDSLLLEAVGKLQTKLVDPFPQADDPYPPDLFKPLGE